MCKPPCIANSRHMLVSELGGLPPQPSILSMQQSLDESTKIVTFFPGSGQIQESRVVTATGQALVVAAAEEGAWSGRRLVM